MKTQASAIRTIYKFLIASGANQKTGITGGIYWMARPKDSVKEDIVISGLAMDAEDLQHGVININIHVPNLQLDKDGTQPNFARFESISEVLVNLLFDIWGTDWNFEIDNAAEIIPDGNNWFCNIRLNFYTLRKNN